MAKPRQIPLDTPAFATLPVRRVTVEAGDEQLAVHVAGRLGSDRLPLICVPGYQRNMADFSEFAPLLQQVMATDWPVVLVDLRGRGRSPDRRRAADYTSTADARDLSILTRALGIEAAIFLGEGHGGQVIMSLGAARPALVGGAVLINSGPVSVPQSLIRLRSNLEAIGGLRGRTGLTTMLRRMLAAEYPEAGVDELDRLAGRTHYIDSQGRPWPLFDPALVSRLDSLDYDDVLVPQWPLFDVLNTAPLMFLRTEFTDQLPREVLDEMMRRRPDARSLEIAGQGSPALLDRPEEVGAIGEFVEAFGRLRMRQPRRA